jgi:hypothetical protein
MYQSVDRHKKYHDAPMYRPSPTKKNPIYPRRNLTKDEILQNHLSVFKESGAI